MVKLRAPGMRTIKTTLIVAICLMISEIFDLSYPFYAAIAAIICTQNTVSGSFKEAKNRTLGTIIGSLLGVFCVFAFQYNPWISGIGILVLIYFLKFINLEEAYVVAAIMYLSIFRPGIDSTITYSLHRTFDTIIGILVALIINWLLAPPEYADDIRNSSYTLIDDLLICCGNFIIHHKEMELSKINSEILKIEDLMENYEKDKRKSKIKIINSYKLNRLIEDSKKLYNHLGMINELYKLGFSCVLNEENANYIRDIYNHSLPFYKYEEAPHNEAFNYHVKELLKHLDYFRELSLK